MLALSNYTVDAATGCWLWNGTLNDDGYAQVTVASEGCPSGVTTQKVHRVLYERKHGPVPEGLVLDHGCRRRRCVNPDHVEPVTNAVNVRRGNSTKLSEAQVAEIRGRYKAGDVSQKALGDKFGVSESLIHLIVTGKWWMVGIENPVLSLNNKPGRRPKLNPKEASALAAEYLSGSSQAVLAKRYNLSPAAVCMFVKQFKKENV